MRGARRRVDMCAVAMCALAAVLRASAPVFASLVLLLASSHALTGTALAADPDYPAVVPGRAIELPRDAGSHPAHRIEWWYVTGWLADRERRTHGFQVTFFRVRPGVGEDNPSRFAPRQVLFAHAAVADPGIGRLRHAERSAREGFDLAYAREGRMDVRIDDWTLSERDGRLQTVVAGTDFALQLELEITQPVLLQGASGYSRKGSDALSASYYYSLPHLAVSGELAIEGRSTPVTGEAWLDHEWSSQELDFEARGWDWTGVNLDDGGALMAFQMRDARGRARWAAGTLRKPSGELTIFAPDEVAWTRVREWQSSRTGIRYPVAWRLELGSRVFLLDPLMDDAELDSRGSTGTIYWEGPARLLDADRQPIGRGYVELTGYK
jgi:predicted secreted hydrolase